MSTAWARFLFTLDVCLGNSGVYFGDFSTLRPNKRSKSDPKIHASALGSFGSALGGFGSAKGGFGPAEAPGKVAGMVIKMLGW